MQRLPRCSWRRALSGRRLQCCAPCPCLSPQGSAWPSVSCRSQLSSQPGARPCPPALAFIPTCARPPHQLHRPERRARAAACMPHHAQLAHHRVPTLQVGCDAKLLEPARLLQALHGREYVPCVVELLAGRGLPAAPSESGQPRALYAHMCARARARARAHTHTHTHTQGEREGTPPCSAGSVQLCKARSLAGGEQCSSGLHCVS